MSSPEIIVYSKSPCPHCVRAKALLKSKGGEFREVDVTTDEAAYQTVVAHWRGRGRQPTVPLVVIDGVEIGGHDDLVAYFAPRS